MTADEAGHLKDCNAFVQYRKDGPWLPAIKTGPDFTTPEGLEIVPPFVFRDVTRDEIIAEMDERGEVPVWNFGL